MSDLMDMVQALLRPEAYPERPASVELVETHISFIFLTGQYVYKVKKPVNFGFLDFTTLEKRKHFCDQEVALNRRLSPDVYLGVVEVRKDDGRYAVDGPGQTAEYAVKMRQLPRERSLQAMLARGEVGSEQVRRVAEKIARFHQETESGPEITRAGGLETVRTNVEENFQQTEKYVGGVLDADAFDDLVAYSRAFMEARQDLLRRREEDGRIRDCHGDLHSAQIFLDDGIQVIDCIEFNERFRYSDVALDVAFLAMDLDHHGRGDLSRVLMEAYVQASGDTGVWPLLDFYKCYRAYVRAKVTSFRLDEPQLPAAERQATEKMARSYYSLAHQYARRAVPRPALFLVAGLMGTGKSHLAAELGRRWEMAALSSDIARKALAGIGATEHRYEPFGQGIYSAQFDQKTYHQMFQEAAEALRQGQSVVLDASFRQSALRRSAIEVAQRAGAQAWVIECTAPDEEIHRRLARRTSGQEETVSDGRWEIYHAQKAAWEPVAEVPPHRHIQVNTSGTSQETVRRALELLSISFLTQED
ncbi:MAG: AAA family ATPase [Chloroflexi bacterium]|nr:AAA family ATPase [Chloroflexota bacterium]